MRRVGAAVARSAAVVAIALLLSSCIKLDMELTVSAGNTVSGTAIVGVDKQILSAFGQTPDQVFGKDTLAPVGTPGVTTSNYEDDMFIGQKITFVDTPISALSASQDQDSLRIVRDGDVFRVTGALDMSNTSGDPSNDQLIQQAMSTAEIEISITFPGTVTSSNGAIDGNTVSWKPAVGKRTELSAVASAIASGSSPVIWIVVGVAAVAVLGGGVLVMRRRKPPVAVPPEADASADAAPPEADAPPPPEAPGASSA
jgi:hypothetical protein